MTAAPTALVTGTSSGFGRGVAERLSSLGWQVLGTVRSDEGDLPFETIRCDVTDDSAVARLGAEVERRWGRLDALVNNAGAALAGPVEELSTDELRWQLDVNVVGPLAVLRACLPALRAAQGVVVQVSSESGITGDGMFSAYNASKFAVRGFTESLRHELRGTGVRAVTIHPGGVKTNIARNGRLREDTEGWGRTPDDIAEEFEARAEQHKERALRRRVRTVVGHLGQTVARLREAEVARSEERTRAGASIGSIRGAPASQDIVRVSRAPQRRGVVRLIRGRPPGTRRSD